MTRPGPDTTDRFADATNNPTIEAAERVILGAMLTAPTAIVTAQDSGLTPSDFGKLAHGDLYRLIIESQSGANPVPVDPHAITLWLDRRGALRRVGGVEYLHTLVAAVPTVANTGWYAQQVIAAADRRRMLTALARAAQVAAGSSDPDQLATAAQTVIQAAQPRTRDNGLTFLGDYAHIGMRDIEMRPTRSRGVPTGFVDLDRLIGGMRPGQLIVIAGRPGMGKTTLGLDIARHVSIGQGLTTVYISLEMTVQELFDRCLAAQASIPYHLVRDGTLSDDDWQRASRAVGPMSEAPLGIADATDQTVVRIGNRLRRQARTSLDLAIIDHLGLIRDPSAARQGRQNEVAQIARDLKTLAKDLSIPIISLVQLNRANTARGDKVPQLTDLRESGEIEQSADIVIMVHREDYYDAECPRAGEADLIIRKNRGGPTDTVTVASQLHFARFVDMAVE